ncbi:hypothetical protein GF324_00435 [bacterium]|nr:hypothetical protein [bacterium]
MSLSIIAGAAVAEYVIPSCPAGKPDKKAGGQARRRPGSSVVYKNKNIKILCFRKQQ